MISDKLSQQENLPQFSIFDHLDSLTPVEKRKDRYYCPVCKGNNLTIDPKSGAYKCWNDCECEDIRNAIAPLNLVAPKPHRQRCNRTWSYTDSNGKEIIKMRRRDDGLGEREIWQEYLIDGQWQSKSTEEAKPAREAAKKAVMPYNYAAVQCAIANGEPVFWVEGEPCVDAMEAIGLAATTSIGGSAGYGKYGDYSQSLKGAKLVICPDRDLPGLKYAGEVAKDYPDAQWLYAFPDSPLWNRLAKDGGLDVADWIEDLRKERLLDEAIAACILGAIEPQRISKPSTEPSQSQDKPPKKTAGQILMDIAKTAKYFHSPDKTPYADVWIDGNRHTYRLRSTDFRDWLKGRYYKAQGKSISAQSFQNEFATLESEAKFDGETRDVHLRVAEENGKLYLDLGTADWKAVEIDATGWRLVSDPPVRFWRPNSLLPLPYPTEGGSLDELRDLLNVDGKAWTLIVSFILFCYHPKHHKPILILHGEQGSGKTTVAEFLKSLIDPGKGHLLSAIGDDRAMGLSASRRWILAYDNLSGISGERSDALCRTATGNSSTTRALYTDEDEIIFEFTRPQIITGIDSLATRGDLLQRSLMVSLPSITPDRRKTREALETQLNEARPRILGALLTALSQTLKALPDTNPANLPRMADFGRFAIAAETALGLKEGDFVGAFDDNQEEAHEIVLESSPVAQAILRLMDNRTVWQGTVSELLADLEPLTPEKTPRSRQWPGNARAMGKALTRLAPDLRGLGIDVDFLRSGKAGTRIVVLEKLAKKTSETSAMSEPSQGKDYKADMKADKRIEADMKRQPNVSQNVSPRTHSQQEIELSADMADMADMKNTPFSKEDIFNSSQSQNDDDGINEKECDDF